jgi:hypothetical protein
MQSVAAGAASDVNEFADAEVAFARGSGADGIGLIGESDMKRVAVHIAKNGDRFDAQFVASAGDADGDFTAIGNENLVEHRRFATQKKFSMRRRRNKEDERLSLGKNAENRINQREPRALTVHPCRRGNSRVWAGKEFLKVGLNTVSGAAANEIAQFEKVGVGNGIEDAVATAAASDEAAIVESLEVLGDIGLIAAESSGDIADGAFAVFEELKDAEAVGFAEEAEATSNGFEDALIRKRAKSFLGHGKTFLLTIRPYRHTVVKKKVETSRGQEDGDPGKIRQPHASF